MFGLRLTAAYGRVADLGSITRARVVVAGLVSVATLATALPTFAATPDDAPVATSVSRSTDMRLRGGSTAAFMAAQPTEPTGPFGPDTGTGPGLPPGSSPVEQTGVVRTQEAINLPAGSAPDATERAQNAQRPPTRIVVPGEEAIGLTRDNPIPLGWTCSCTIDRVGTLSQFDITVLQVVRNAYPMIQQLNRFNPQPRPQHQFVAVYVGQNYIAGPENVAYTVSESDFRASATDRGLEDTLTLLHIPAQYRLQYDAYPGNYVNGWLFYELPVNRPAVLAWRYSFFGERAIWFALQ